VVWNTKEAVVMFLVSVIDNGLTIQLVSPDGRVGIIVRSPHGAYAVRSNSIGSEEVETPCWYVTLMTGAPTES